MLLRYSDYSIDSSRKKVLLHNIDNFIESLGKQIEEFSADPFSNKSGIHITGSEAQANSDVWFKFRQLRVSASFCLDFSKNPLGYLKSMLWNEKPDLSSRPAVKWGKDHERDAIA